MKPGPVTALKWPADAGWQGSGRPPGIRTLRTGRGTAAFTMVELALALGVIAFALVAILGVMPTGIRVQQDNREDTIINQDGTFLLEAIRSGSWGLDDLTNYVLSITVSNETLRRAIVYTNAPTGGKPNYVYGLTNGFNIVGLLGTPKYDYRGGLVLYTNRVTALVRSISGGAIEKSKLARDVAFTYFVRSEVVPLSVYPPYLTNFAVSGLSSAEFATRSNQWLMARNMATNFNELRLTLQGPAVPGAKGLTVLGTPKTFRTLVAGAQVRTDPVAFVRPERFRRVAP